MLPGGRVLMYALELTIRSARVVAKVRARITDALDEAGVVRRDLGRYYALLEQEYPGRVVTPPETVLVRDALPAYRAARRADVEDHTLAGAVVAYARSGDINCYEVDLDALVGRLRDLSGARLLAVVDLAERADDHWLRRDDDAGRPANRFGILA